MQASSIRVQLHLQQGRAPPVLSSQSGALQQEAMSEGRRKMQSRLPHRHFVFPSIFDLIAIDSVTVVAGS